MYLPVPILSAWVKIGHLKIEESKWVQLKGKTLPDNKFFTVNDDLITVVQNIQLVAPFRTPGNNQENSWSVAFSTGKQRIFLPAMFCLLALLI